MDYRSITAQRARELFSYCPRTGVISRREAVSKRAPAGPLRVCNNGSGYHRVHVDGCRVYLHRLAWLLYHGVWPSEQVDHVDGDRGNNRISNLRDVSHTANAQNIHVPKSSGSSGYLGVSWDKDRGLYTAQISVGPRGSAKGKYLGRYATAEEAHQAYLRAKAIYHPAAAIAA